MNNNKKIKYLRHCHTQQSIANRLKYQEASRSDSWQARDPITLLSPNPVESVKLVTENQQFNSQPKISSLNLNDQGKAPDPIKMLEKALNNAQTH